MLACFGGFIISGLAIALLGFLPGIFFTATGSKYGSVITVTAIVILIIAAIAVFSTLYSIGIIKIIQSAHRNEPRDLTAVFKESWAMVGPGIWVAALFTVKVILWLLLLIVPGIIFGLFYSFCSLCFVVDGKRGNEAL